MRAVLLAHGVEPMAVARLVFAQVYTPGLDARWQFQQHLMHGPFSPASRQPLSLVGPSICALQVSPKVIDLPGVIEIMADHDSNEGPGRKELAPIGWSWAIKL